MDYALFAARVASVYQTYTASLEALYLRTRLAGQQLTPRTVLDMQVAAQGLRNDFLSAADALTAEYLNTTFGGALTEPAVTERGVSFVKAMGDIAHDNILTTVRRVRGEDRKALFTSMEGSLKDLLRRDQEKLEFATRDSAGRTWQAAALVRFLARDFAYQLAIDATARDLLAAGDLARIQYADPNHANHGLVVSLTGAAGYPSLASVRKTIFHPNASAGLAHVSA